LRICTGHSVNEELQKVNSYFLFQKLLYLSDHNPKHMRNKLFVAILLIAVLTFSGCTDKENVPNTNDNGSAEDIEYVEIYIDDYNFHPQTLTISRGDTVRWTNNDSVAYIVKSSAFQSPTLTKGMTFTYTFYESRTYNCYLATHPYTKGGIIVVE
jgi:plastocyanin